MIKKMTIAILVDEFPSLPQTFVLNQIIGMIKLGHNVYIFAERAGSYTKENEDYRNHNLLERTIYHNIPQNKFIRLLKAIIYIIKYAQENVWTIFKCFQV
jgi:colanic acid/amylovoran biosynthesis glycosyltransferase